MIPVFYDLHLHSCLSPCGDGEMTPNNLVNMAAIKELDMIALTDHNTCRNCPAVLKVAEQAGIRVIPGMELTTAEEVHVVCLFPALENALAFDEYVYARLMDVKNQPSIFGEQLILDENDEPVGELEKLLVNATSIGISKTPALVDSFGGICYPAHIDRQSYSVLANLGYIPPECGFTAVEVYRPDVFFAGGHGDIREGYCVMTSSDAHRLEDIAERERCIHLETADFAGLRARLAFGADPTGLFRQSLKQIGEIYGETGQA